MLAFPPRSDRVRRNREPVPLNLPTTQRQDHLGVAYVRAVAAKAGCTSLTQESGTDFGIDVTVYEIALIRGKPKQNGAEIKIQLKSTITAEFKDGHVVYDLDSNTYNNFMDERYSSRILVLYVMPREIDRWLTVNQDGTMLRNCAYWHILPWGGAIVPSESTKRIKIPESQVFDPAGLVDLMNRARGNVL